ncbi:MULTISPECIES: fimbrial protein [Providencia]|uniref:Fimbrial protein n=1 Tax=Providencia rettgeri TaxID=587 RepID=A0AAJ6FT92_PRORE|nr:MULTISPECIES: fimbrial protein [Providencia]ELR5166288.1 type 1 fimbrial protein [Providencia rettgeri]ELR5245707.1 type 1 fimbrial protein [Providencia rettgeri]WHT81748.1 fimbrial protein [Providencia rettgeri]WHT95917.1 fimbrial protein [Providencia rettgeri]WJM88282.1 fimbrial protein [Providencia rettgeri]
MRKKILFTPVIFSLFFCVYAKDTRASATVKIRGSIVETACAIDVGSRDQTIDMGNLPLSTLHRDGQGPIRHFQIRLVNCVLARQDPAKPNWQYFRVTFDGSQSRGLFTVNGQASGIGLQIQRDDGEIAIPGKGLPRQSLPVGERDLSYQLRLIANQDVLMSGQYSSQLRFKLDYE